MKRLLLLFTLLSPALAHAQPADDPSLSQPPPPPPPPPPPQAQPAPVPHSSGSATIMPPAEEAPRAPEMHETTDTQVQWVEGAGEATGDNDLYARTAAPTVSGPIGLFRTMTGDVGRANNFRVGLSLQMFTQDNFLVAGVNGGKGDTDNRFLGNLTIDYTPWKYLELYLAVLNSSNQNQRAETPAMGRTDPEVILALGDVAAGLKARYGFTPWFDLALHLGLRFFNSVNSVSVEGSATNFSPDLIASFDLRHAAATAKVPLRFHINFGYVLDNSIDLLPAGQCMSSVTNDPCIRSRVVETFAYGINPSRFRLAAAVDSPLAFAHDKVGLDLIFEYHVDIAVGDGDQTVARALTMGGIFAGSPDRITGQSQQYLTFGARVRPVAGLILDAGLDVGLSSYGFQYGPPLPVWNVLLGAAYAYDVGAGRGKTKIVTKTIVRETPPAAEGKLRGFVRDANTKKPIIGATVKYTTRRATAQLTGDDGSFVSQPFAPGPVSIEVSRDDYEAKAIDTSVGPNGETPLEVLLVAKPPAEVPVRVKVSDDGGMPIGTATVRLTNTGTAATVDAEPEGMAGYNAKVQPGDYMIEVNATGYLSKPKTITVVAGQPQNVEMVLRKKPTVSHVTVGKSEIFIKGTIHFGTNNAEIKPDGEQLLDEVADVLAKHPEIRRLRVEGHTDNRGSPDRNLALSKARAAAVVQYLVKAGVDPSRLESEGYGSTQPLVPNITPAQRAKNRRVAFKILERQ